MNHQPLGYSVARLQELLAKKATLEREIEQTQRKERSAAIAHVRTLMEQYGITPADLGPSNGRRGRASAAAPKSASTKRASKLKGKKVPPKYRNKATGDAWSGRGLQPKWLTAALAAGKKLSDFAV